MESQSCHLLLLTASLTVCLSGCSRSSSNSGAASHAPSASASSASSPPLSASALGKGLALAPAEIQKAVNPSKMPVYRGPAGTLRGTVTVTGDAPPAVKVAAPEKCSMAQEMYGTLFRKGMNDALADALVTVTGYDGFLPAEVETVQVPVRGCAYATKTVALTVGQRIEVTNDDRETYLPKLLGASLPATLALIPRGDPIRFVPEQPGRYMLAEAVHGFMLSDVFVLRFRTFSVTKLDGKYEIAGLPAGEVTVHALLPATMQTVEKKVRITANQTVDLNLSLAFDRKAWEAQAREAKAKAGAP